ncbi:MAG: DEAD/DEAH box helicase family protein, partial [Paludibacteraceae bacterium]|nr:DEAD/DEAH box helicase family protein [Paludibacteraceae bacterium]
MRNFDYIKDLGFDDLHRYCSAAEETQVCDPEMSAFHCRRALEYMVRELYVMKGIVIPERTLLLQMVDDESFSKFINDPKVMMAVHYVRKVGNHGAHAMKVTKQESFFCLLNIYNVVAAILLKLQLIQTVKPFDKNLIPGKPNIHVVPPAEIKVSESDAIVKQANKEAVESTDPVVEMDCPDLSEDDTRKMFINLMLKEAGWEVMEKEGLIQPLKACIEIEVDGMPTTSKKGYADYVLFGSNGKPLAVVEAKRTSKSPDTGKHQAELYADCLEAKYGVRPVIYYTNGFETYIIDGLGYPPRRLYSFHTATDLELMIQKRSRHDINDFKVNGKITDRDYQKMSIKAVCEHFNKKHRKGLIVMATGTGKTRVAISLVDILTRNEWVKNALFLADRTSLVNQAHKNFVKLLPNMTTCVLSDDSEHDLNARLTFSTYQTMINHIDTEDKTFSVGRFDLIIIDEAHRSIFGKYGAIFNYFDSLLIGLTATPRDEVDRSTYEIFEMEQGEPNFAYELEEAVADGYLVNYIGIKRGSKIMREGIKYDELSPEEKAQLEKVFEYERINKALEGEPGRDIAASEIFTYIFNDDTISHVLQDLMSNGLKIKGSEEIGKTIIFAYNHRHAEMIVEKFNKLFP